jgi:hypothetical protein
MSIFVYLDMLWIEVSVSGSVPRNGNPQRVSGFEEPGNSCGFPFLETRKPPSTFCEKTANEYVNIRVRQKMDKKWILKWVPACWKPGTYKGSECLGIELETDTLYHSGSGLLVTELKTDTPTVSGVPSSISRNSESLWVPSFGEPGTHFKIHFYPFFNSTECSHNLLLSFHKKSGWFRVLGSWKPKTRCGFPFLGTWKPSSTFCGKTGKGYVNISFREKLD